MSPREIAWGILQQSRLSLRAHAFQLLSYLLETALRQDTLTVRAGRRKVMRDIGMCRKGFDLARRDLNKLIPIIAATNGFALTYDLRALWQAGLQGSPAGEAIPGLHGSPAGEAIPGLHGSPAGEAVAGLYGSPVQDTPGLYGSPAYLPSTGPPGEPGSDRPGLQGSPVLTPPTGPLGEPGSAIPGLQGSPVRFPQPGLQGSPVYRGPGLQGSPVRFPQPGLQGSPVQGGPGLQGSPDEAKKSETDRHGSRSRLIDRSINQENGENPNEAGAGGQPETELREPNESEVQTAKSYIRVLRYQDGKIVHATADTAVIALKAAGSMERLRWALQKLETRTNSNHSWRPKEARTFRPWIRKSIAMELSTLDRLSESPAAEEQPQPIANGRRGPEVETEHVDTAALISGLATRKVMK